MFRNSDEPIGGLFPATRWGVVKRMVSPEASERLSAWDDFVTAYRRPLIVWLKARCGDELLAEELVQSLIVKLFAREESFQGVTPAKGRLRTWLLTALKHHWIDHLRKRKVASEEPGEDIAVDESGDAEALFDLEWARALARAALERARADYEGRDRAALFDELLVAMDDPRDVSHQQRAESLGMTSNAFAVALMRFRERVAAKLWEEVAGTVGGKDADIDAELRHLITVLGRSGGLRAAYHGGRAE